MFTFIVTHRTPWVYSIMAPYCIKWDFNVFFIKPVQALHDNSTAKCIQPVFRSPEKAVRTSITLWCHNKAVRIWYHCIHKKLTVFVIIQKTASQSEERPCEPERGDVKLLWGGFWFLKPKIYLLGNCRIWQMCWINFLPHKTFANIEILHYSDSYLPDCCYPLPCLYYHFLIEINVTSPRAPRQSAETPAQLGRG